MAVQLIVVPYELGTEGVGEGLGPGRLIELGAREQLSSANASVEEDWVRLPSPEPRESETGRTFALLAQVSEHVARALRRGRFPLVLGGSCITSVGVVAGLLSAGATLRPGLVWFDAHGDFNTPETTLSGYLDGMPVAAVTGRCWSTLSGSVPGFHPLPDGAVALVGVRDLDPGEADLLRRSRVGTISARDIKEAGRSERGLVTLLDRRLRKLRQASDGIHLHVDLDVLDPAEAPANHYLAENGLRASELIELVHHLIRAYPVRSATIAAYDPSCDPAGRVPPVALRIMGALAGAPPPAAPGSTRA